MTTWSWKCRACGIEFTNPIFRFIPKCPECEVEYIQLASANGSPSIGEMPIFAFKDEKITNKATRNSVLFAIATKAKYIECYSSAFYEYLQNEFSEKLSEKNIALKLVEMGD